MHREEKFLSLLFYCTISLHWLLIAISFTICTSFSNTEAPDDYLADSGVLVFSTGDDRQCHRVRIVDDEFCDPEQFFSNLALVPGAPVIIIDPASAQIFIQDSDCGKQELWYTVCQCSITIIFISQ